MPHFVVESGGTLAGGDDRQAALKIAADCGAQSGVMQAEDIKARLIHCPDFLALDGRRSFLHITVRLLAGRSDAQKTALSEAWRDAMAVRFADVQSISIDICDMDPGPYKKRLI